MHSHELLRDVLQKGSAKQIADDLGLSLSMIYKWAEPPGEGGSGSINPLDRIHALVESTGDLRLVHWLCQRAGGFYIRNPKGQRPPSQELIPSTNRIVQEFADLLSVVAMAATDNQISAQEARTIRARWEDLKSVTEGFVRGCEEGNFARVREELKEPSGG